MQVTGGRNGYGAKLANIFSTKFVVETCDGKRGRRYKQAFSKNMSKKGEPIITCVLRAAAEGGDRHSIAGRQQRSFPLHCAPPP